MVAALALVGCTPTPYSAAIVADKREGRVFAYMLKVGSVMIPQYRDEWTLRAIDASICYVSPATYAEATAGKVVVCQWEDR